MGRPKNLWGLSNINTISYLFVAVLVETSLLQGRFDCEPLVDSLGMFCAEVSWEQ
jgi:hypothetical protein